MRHFESCSVGQASAEVPRGAANRDVDRVNQTNPNMVARVRVSDLDILAIGTKRSKPLVRLADAELA